MSLLRLVIPLTGLALIACSGNDPINPNKMNYSTKMAIRTVEGFDIERIESVNSPKLYSNEKVCFNGRYVVYFKRDSVSESIELNGNERCYPITGKVVFDKLK